MKYDVFISYSSRDRAMAIYLDDVSLRACQR
jgi:hypothetical protein